MTWVFKRVLNDLSNTYKKCKQSMCSNFILHNVKSKAIKGKMLLNNSIKSLIQNKTFGFQK